MKTLNSLLIAGLTLGLGACASTTTLQSTDGNVSGKLSRNLIEPHQVEVTLDGKAYRGDWRTSAPSKEQRQTAGFPHQKHIGQVNATLKADDGGILNCRWQTHGDQAEGTCTSAGRDYPLKLN